MSKIADFLNRAWWRADRIKDTSPRLEEQINLLQEDLREAAEAVGVTIDEDNDALLGDEEET